MFCTFVDATKASDRVSYDKLFKLIVHRMLSPGECWVSAKYVHLACLSRLLEWRLLGFLFCFKLSHARWCYPPCAFCMYIDELLGTLAEAGLGCYIGNISVIALAYADNIVLLAATARVLRLLLGFVIIMRRIVDSLQSK